MKQKHLPRPHPPLPAKARPTRHSALHLVGCKHMQDSLYLSKPKSNRNRAQRLMMRLKLKLALITVISFTTIVFCILYMSSFMAAFP